MAATRTRPRSASNGSSAASKARDAGESVTDAARSAKGPLLTAGVAAAGLAGGMALGSRLASKRRKILGLPIGPKRRSAVTAGAMVKAARGLGSAARQASRTTDDVRDIRELLDQANRRSPIEIVLDGLTHRRGAHKRET
jgi:hypothetical protein